MRQKNYWSYFAFRQTQVVEGKIVPAMLLPRGKKDTAFWHFPNLTRKGLFGIRGKSTAGVILPFWSSGKDNTLAIALGPCNMT